VRASPRRRAPLRGEPGGRRGGEARRQDGVPQPQHLLPPAAAGTEPGETTPAAPTVPPAPAASAAAPGRRASGLGASLLAAAAVLL
jgi:hypothetical protein